MSEENTPVAKEEVKEQAKAIASTLAEKADSCYNKLPLDSINEKLAAKGIKMDVKSRRFKLALSGILVILVILVAWGGCRGENEKQGKTVTATETGKAGTKADAVRTAKNRMLNEFIKDIENSGLPVPLNDLKSIMDSQLEDLIAKNEETHAMTDKQLIAAIRNILNEARRNARKSSSMGF